MARSSTRRARTAGAPSASMNRFLAIYPSAEAKGIKPAGVGTVTLATELVEKTVEVVV